MTKKDELLSQIEKYKRLIYDKFSEDIDDKDRPSTTRVKNI
jgi:hypothetical protein